MIFMLWRKDSAVAVELAVELAVEISYILCDVVQN